jgi:hypothetical protein
MEFDLENIYTSIARYIGFPFPKYITKLPGYKVDQFGKRIDYIRGKRSVADMYGRPVVVPVRINGVELGSNKDGHIMLQPLVVIEGTKKWSKATPVGGSYHGSIKQFINLDDYKIELFGALINTNQKEYPTQQLEILISKMWQLHKALTFECEITENLFSHIVIKKIKLHDLKKAPGIQMYEIKAESDTIHEAEYLKGV